MSKREERKIKNSALSKARFRRFKEAGLCSVCGKARDTVRLICTTCSGKLKERWRKRNRTLKESGLCVVCGESELMTRSLCKTCRSRTLERSKVRRRTNVEKYKERSRKQLQDLRIQIIEAYGGWVCACCGETIRQFLTLDHVYNDGFKEKKVGRRTRDTSTFFRRLRREGFPNKDRYQVLCWNCNLGKARNNGVCPHRTYGLGIGPSFPTPEKR